jgi:hypothetical protein
MEEVSEPQMAATALAEQPNPNLQAAASSVAHKINGVSETPSFRSLVIHDFQANDRAVRIA